MADVEECSGSFNSAVAGGNDWSTTLFSQLKSLSVQLLELLQCPEKNSPAPSQLLQLLRQSPPTALQSLFDYALFPLLLLLDAAVESRSLPKHDAKESCVSGPPGVSHKVSDVVAEGVLRCLEELLYKCPLGSVDQFVIILKKLTHGALLSPLEAPEEFREGTIRCFRALLLSLHPCSDELCSCKQVKGCPMLLSQEDQQSPLAMVSKYTCNREECLLTFLQSKSASAAVGHWLSLLLKAAEVEAARGHRGSASLRVEAFTTLRVLIAKVGNADALAFFLPGVVSHIGKVLHVSKTMISGAAGSTQALDQAIRGLAEFLSIVLKDDHNLPAASESVDDFPVHHSGKEKSLVSFLDELRHLPSKIQGGGKTVVTDSNDTLQTDIPVSDIKAERSIDPDATTGILRVNRTNNWIANGSLHINRLLSATFPHLCVHPSEKVREGTLAAIDALLSNCSHTLKDSRLLLLECLLLLVCDDSQEVSSVAQAFFGLIYSCKDHQMESDITMIFSRLVEKLPQAVLGNEESLALSHVRKLLAVIYFSGPQFVVEFLCQSPMTAAKFMDAFALCLGQTSVFAGSLNNLLLARPSGYLQSIAEMRGIISTYAKGAEYVGTKNNKNQQPVKHMQKIYELPQMPPWFVYVGSEKLYRALAGVLRLVGLASFAGSGNEGSLSVILDIPLAYLRKLISDIRAKEYNLESWESWYNRTGSGQLVRHASTAACILNEMIFGLSDQSINTIGSKFQRASLKWQDIEGHGANINNQSIKLQKPMQEKTFWKVRWENGPRNYLIDCIGSILHEYLSPEIWNLPLDNTDPSFQFNGGDEALSLHFFKDNAMLYQVLTEGIGIFAMCLGKDFSSCGFLHSSLFMLLENLTCSNFDVRAASDAVLHVLAATLEYQTVGHLVLANADYVIDSICRQLRHLDLNPQMPNVLAVMLSYIGIGHKILPLLEEPMHAVSQELEVLGRHKHPELTIPFLKAIAEIAKSSKQEACTLPSQAETFHKDIKSDVSDVEKRLGTDSFSPSECEAGTELAELVHAGIDASSSHVEIQVDHWESIVYQLNDSRRYRRTVGSIAASCLAAATPILASNKQTACLIALDIIEDGIVALAQVEEAYKHEKGIKEALEHLFSLCSLPNLQDALDAAQDESGENRLLPAMNKIWPLLVACVRNRNPVVVRRCSHTTGKVVQICGGDFFSRRFHGDGLHFWKLLSTSPFQRKPVSKEERAPLQLPYRSSCSTASEDKVAELSDQKVQAAVLNMIADIAQNKRSASALELVLKKVSGLVVGIACSGVTGLRDAATKALVGLSSIDPDLIWLLLADVYFTLKKKDVLSPPAEEFPEISEILPPPSSSKEYLYVVYGGQSYGFDIDVSAVEQVFKTLHSQSFT